MISQNYFEADKKEKAAKTILYIVEQCDETQIF